MTHPLATDPAFADWITALAALDLPSNPAPLPGKDDLAAFLTYAEVPAAQIPAILDTRADIGADPDWQWLFQRCVHYLRANMDRWDWSLEFPQLPESTGESGKWFFLHVFAAVFPHTQALYAKRGISDDIAQATLADIGRHVHIHHARTGEPGLADPGWLQLHLRGMIFQLGRLQFERARLGGTTSRALQAQGHPWNKGHPMLAVHIPSLSGPLTREACDRSFALADAFYQDCFPELAIDLAVCHSWLMDRQLADYLPEASNIVHFQRRFQIAYTPEPNNRDTLEFVFRTPDRPLDELPQNSTLERAVVGHIRAGKSWHGGMGWLKWPAH